MWFKNKFRSPFIPSPHPLSLPYSCKPLNTHLTPILYPFIPDPPIPLKVFQMFFSGLHHFPHTSVTWSASHLKSVTTDHKHLQLGLQLTCCQWPLASNLSIVLCSTSNASHHWPQTSRTLSASHLTTVTTYHKPFVMWSIAKKKSPKLAPKNPRIVINFDFKLIKLSYI